MAYNIIELVIAAFAVLVFFLDRWEAKKRGREQLELDKQKLNAETKATENNLRFQRESLDLERRASEERIEWLDRQSVRITQIADTLSERIALQLKEDSQWAVEALTKAKLIPHSDTLFSNRLGHYQAEKECLAKAFVPLLLNRCRHFAESGKQVYLLVDSGTTLYSFMEHLGKAALQIYANKEEWLQKLTIVTNNIPGMQNLTASSLINPHSRFSGLAVNLHFLPGKPLPIYAAVTGDETNSALQSIRDKASGDGKAVIIGLVVGNWIRLRRTEPKCPIPLVRGSGHLAFKQKLMDISDEIYVISPLGKIFMDVSHNEVNNALGFSIANPNPDRQPYDEVEINDDKAKSIRLVSTTRERSHILYELSTKLITLLDISHQSPMDFAQLPFKDVKHLGFPFNMLPKEWEEQFEVEFPHNYPANKHDFASKFFFVKPNHS